MVSLIKPFVEYGNAEGASMKQSFEAAPYNGQREVSRYLRTKGTELGISMRIPTDFFTGEIIPGISNTFYTDGDYSWNETLAYYVEKYNLRLPESFVQHVLAKITA